MLPNYRRSRNLEFMIVDSCLAQTKSHSQINSLATVARLCDVTGHENQSQHYPDHRYLCLELSGRITTPDGFSYHTGAQKSRTPMMSMITVTVTSYYIIICFTAGVESPSKYNNDFKSKVTVYNNLHISSLISARKQ